MMDENKSMNFETALARLEQIVKLLESGSAPLDDSLALFEEGVALVKLCNSKLDNVERRIKILVNKGEEMEEQDFVKESGEAK